MKQSIAILIIIILLADFFPISVAGDQNHKKQSENEFPSFLQDRGREITTSMFGTYISKGELLFYPFFEYYKDNNSEYSPDELGYQLDKDFRGKYRAYETLIFVGYGLTDNISVEVEAAYIDATLDKSPNDPTNLPSEITESGLGDTQFQVNWMWRKETAGRAGLFSYAEVVFPFNKTKKLTGTPDFEFKVGSGIVRGFSWGTLIARGAVEYDMAERNFDIGEVAVEYLKRLSPHWRLYLGIEGVQDEFEFISEIQWHISKNMFLKVNNAFGITSKATGWAPEIGIMFRL